MKKIKKSWLKLVSVIMALLLLPIYAVAWIMFKTAIVRDNKSTFLENRWVKALTIKIGDALKTIKNNGIEQESGERGKEFADFAKETECGRQWFFTQNRERITMISFDGLRLVAYYLSAEEESDKVMVLMHGYRNDGFGDFSGLVRFYHEMGYHLLVPHQRSHGESEGEYICYGVKERYDLKQWVEYVIKRFEGKCKVFLSGISMGGATVLMAAGLPLPEQVKGIVADCAFTSPWDIFAHVMKTEYHLSKTPYLYIADYICRIKAGFCFKECSTVACMKTNRIPVLFIHGGKDTFVPTEMSYKNYEACAAPKDILIVKQAAHGTSNLVEPERYRSTVVEFMEKWLYEDAEVKIEKGK